MKSLRNTIFFFCVVLLLAVQGIFVQIIHSAIQQQEANQVQSRLDTAQTVFRAQFDSRRRYLSAFAETAARDFGLKQAFQDDERSFLVALNNHRQRIEADVAMAVDARGRISAQLINHPGGEAGEGEVSLGPELDQDFRFPQWLERKDDARLYPLEDTFYQLSVAPLTSGALIIGWVGFGYRLDASLAAYFSELTELNTDFAIREDGRWRLLASSRQADGGSGAVRESSLLNRIMAGTPPASVIATSAGLGSVDQRQLATVMYGDRTDLLAEVRKHAWQLGLLVALTLCLSLGGAFFIATRISHPVQSLVRQAKQIAGGNYDLDFELEASGELGELAAEFKQMQHAVVSRERVISHRAYHDELSGLPNRNRLIQVLAQWTQADTGSFGITKLAIRRINEINSSLGHEVGDEVIRSVARRLQPLAGAATLFHLGGSEFVLLEAPMNATRVGAYAATLRAALESKFTYQSISLFLEVDVGMALYPGHDRQPAGLLRKAATALQHAQRAGTPFQLYQDALSSENMEYLQLINDLRTAIDNRQLVLHYQPKLDLASGGIRQVEALVRWQHPQRGMIAPDRFIGLAEQTGLINPLTRWVLEEAGRQHRCWLQQGISLSIAVNISAQNLKDPHFYAMVTHAMSQAGVDWRAISLEMTESAVVEEPEAALAVLRRFRAARIGLSIDDYGTGYSSLAQLKQLPVTELKIDRSFILSLLNEGDDQIIVRSTLELAHKLNLQVVAEGIEDAATLQWLRQQGCDMGQGYHICRPLPAAELARWLRHEASHPPKEALL